MNGMSVCGVGSVSTYLYNRQTGRLSTKDGAWDEFVDYFNGDLEGKDSTGLNGFDRQNKGNIKRMMELTQEMSLGKDVLEACSGDEIEITSEVEEANTCIYYINGKKIFTAIGAVEYTPEELKIFGSIKQPYKTTCPTGYDPLQNRLSFGVGDSFDFGNGYRFTVEQDSVRVDSYGSGKEEDYKNADYFAFGLSALIHFADQQAFADLYGSTVSTPMMLEFLRELGVDTDRQFILNETACEVRDGKIREAGNKVGVPSSIHRKALERYEEMMSVLLSQEQ